MGRLNKYEKKELTAGLKKEGISKKDWDIKCCFNTIVKCGDLGAVEEELYDEYNLKTDKSRSEVDFMIRFLIADGWIYRKEGRLRLIKEKGFTRVPVL